jgi:hypothetical protein
VVRWENGEVEPEVNANELILLYKNTPQSLGCYTTLSDFLIDKLTLIGKVVGVTLERQRLTLFLKNLRQGINLTNIRNVNVMEVVLSSIGSMVSGTKEVALIGYRQSSDSFNVILNHFVTKANTAKPNVAVDICDPTLIAVECSKAKPKFCIFRKDECQPGLQREWMAIEIKVNQDFYWLRKDDYHRFFIVAHVSKFGLNKITELDLKVLSEVSVEASKALEVIYNREQRKLRRKELLKELESKLFEWKELPPDELSFNFIEALSDQLPGAHVYIGLLQMGGQRIKYVASNILSKMEGRQLKRGEGVSFEVLRDLKTLVLRPQDMEKKNLLKPNARVEVLYGNHRYTAKLGKFRGHQMFDVRYDFDHKVEAGVSVDRIMPLSSAFKVKKFGRVDFPFACVGLQNRGKAVGVLGIDTMAKIEKSPLETHPEPDLLQFLEQAGKLLGAAVDSHRKRVATRVLFLISKNTSSTMEEAINAAFDAVYTNVFYATSVVIAEYVFDKLSEDDDILNEEDTLPPGKMTILKQRGAGIPAEVESKLNKFNPAFSSLRTVQRYGGKLLWLLCRLQAERRGDHGNIYILSVSSSENISEVDVEFLDHMQKLLAGTLQNIVSRKASAELRFESLREIRKLCESWKTMPKQDLFKAVCDEIAGTFYSANPYVSGLTLQNKSLQYIMAGPSSKMLGNVLMRSDEKGVSFDVIDTENALVIRDKSDLHSRLRFFGNKQQMMYPVIMVPIIAHLDALLGVLTVDGADDPSSTTDEEYDGISFFAQVATYLSKAVRGYRQQDYRERYCDVLVLVFSCSF